MGLATTRLVFRKSLSFHTKRLAQDSSDAVSQVEFDDRLNDHSICETFRQFMYSHRHISNAPLAHSAANHANEPRQSRRGLPGLRAAGQRFATWTTLQAWQGAVGIMAGRPKAARMLARWGSYACTATR